MITLEAMREAWAEASKAADVKKATYIRALMHGCEYLIPTTDDRPVFIRCRCCQSVVSVVMGQDTDMPDANQPTHRMHAPSPCGHCRNSVMLPGWTLFGIREAHAQGRTVGLGGKAVPRGLSPLRSMTFDYDASLLGVVGSEASKAHMTMFAGPGQQETVMSVVILLDDASAVEQALAQMENLTVDQIQATFGMPGNFGGPKLRDSRQLDVSDLGETAFGFALTFELPQAGVGDGQWVFFGRDSLLAITVTVAMDGVAPVDAVLMAELMDDKIKGELLQ